MARMRYTTKARKLNEAGFEMVGYGSFDLSCEETAEVLELIEQEQFGKMRKLYESLIRRNL